MSPTLCTSALTPGAMPPGRSTTISPPPVNTASGGLQETRLKQDVYYLEKPRRKTEALIFGSHDSSTLEMTQKMSDYLDILWGAETIPWSMYYLNGTDNSRSGLHPAVEGPLFELQRVNDQQRRGVTARGNAAAG